MVVDEHFCESSEGVDGCAEFSALTGRTRIVHLEGLVVVRVDVEEDAASCDGIRATVVATGAVGGNDDCVAVSGGIVALCTIIAVFAGRQMDHVRESRTFAEVMDITFGSHKVLSGNVAYVLTRVVFVAPVVERVVDATGWVLHRCCLVEGRRQ